MKKGVDFYLFICKNMVNITKTENEIVILIFLQKYAIKKRKKE